MKVVPASLKAIEEVNVVTDYFEPFKLNSEPNVGYIS
jgi:hypothetical protein